MWCGGLLGCGRILNGRGLNRGGIRHNVIQSLCGGLQCGEVGCFAGTDLRLEVGDLGDDFGAAMPRFSLNR